MPLLHARPLQVRHVALPELWVERGGRREAERGERAARVLGRAAAHGGTSKQAGVVRSVMRGAAMLGSERRGCLEWAAGGNLPSTWVGLGKKGGGGRAHTKCCDQQPAFCTPRWRLLLLLRRRL